MQKLYTTLKNRHVQESKRASADDTTSAVATKKTTAQRAKNPVDLFRDKHKEQIKAVTKIELEGEALEHRDGRFLAHYNANAKKLFEQSQPEVKQALEAEAEALKAKLEAGPTPEDIAR